MAVPSWPKQTPGRAPPSPTLLPSPPPAASLGKLRSESLVPAAAASLQHLDAQFRECGGRPDSHVSIPSNASTCPDGSQTDAHSGSVSDENCSSHESPPLRSSLSLPGRRSRRAAGAQVSHKVRREHLSEPQLPQRLRAGPLQLLPGVRARRR